MQEAVEQYLRGFGYYPEAVVVDSIFRNRENLDRKLRFFLSEYWIHFLVSAQVKNLTAVVDFDLFSKLYLDA